MRLSIVVDTETAQIDHRYRSTELETTAAILEVPYSGLIGLVSERVPQMHLALVEILVLSIGVQNDWA